MNKNATKIKGLYTHCRGCVYQHRYSVAFKPRQKNIFQLRCYRNFSRFYVRTRRSPPKITTKLVCKCLLTNGYKKSLLANRINEILRLKR